MQEESIADLIVAIASSLVDRPEEVSLSKKSTESGTLLKLKVLPADVGKIIGKQGRTARSMRTLLGAISVKVGHRYYLEILEERDQDLEGE